MQLLDNHTPNAVLRPNMATIGFFDGVHRGHCFLLSQVLQEASKRGLASSAVTFPVHPRKVVQPDFHPQLLATCSEKVELLGTSGLDYCIMLDFTPTLAAFSARQFMAMLKERYNVQALLVGYDHRFGHNRSEGFDDYYRYGRELGVEVLRAEACSYNDELVVSSSAIRRFLQSGRVEEAAVCLGYRYSLAGEVVEGYRVGRTLGFPTANLRVSDPDKLIPAEGVYAVRVLLEGQTYGGMLCIGNRPTLDNGTNVSIEVHIFQFSGNAYHLPMRIEFVAYMRPEQRFDSLDALVEQLRKDEQAARQTLAQL